MLGTLADHAHDLSDHLGDDHDLALLREEVQRRREAFASPADQRHLLEEIDRRRGELQFAAISLGERIYAEKPKRFTKRLEKRWEALARAQAGRRLAAVTAAIGYPVSNSIDSKGGSHEGLRSGRNGRNRQAAGPDAGRRTATRSSA